MRRTSAQVSYDAVMPQDSPGFSRLDPFEQAHLAAAELSRRTGVERHDVLVVLGTGLSSVAAQLAGTAGSVGVDLSTLAGFPRYTGHGQRARACSVVRNDKRVLITSGRLHLYEGYSPHQVVHPIRTAISAGCQNVILTNAAGAIQSQLTPGSIVLIKDHLNLTATSPLIGIDAEHASRSPFVDLVDAWSPRLREFARESGAQVNEGTYAQVIGPNFETPAEIEMLGALGADLVGMSTVVEAIAAKHLGAELLGVSVVTNAAAGVNQASFSLNDIVDVAGEAAPRIAEIVAFVIDKL